MDLYHNNKLIVKNIKLANNYKSKLQGLLKCKSANDCFIYIPACNMIHTFFMRFTIDIVMLDNKGKVIYLKKKLKPFRVAGCLKAKDTVELKEGSIDEFDIKIGDFVTVKKED